MENFFGTFPSQTFLQLLLAVLLGAFVGLERELRRKEAGMRTYALVSLGAALFVVAAGIGAAVGFQLYWIAVIASFLALFVLASLRKAEEQWIRKRQEQDGEQKK